MIGCILSLCIPIWLYERARPSRRFFSSLLSAPLVDLESNVKRKGNAAVAQQLRSSAFCSSGVPALADRETAENGEGQRANGKKTEGGRKRTETACSQCRPRAPIFGASAPAPSVHPWAEMEPAQADAEGEAVEDEFVDDGPPLDISLRECGLCRRGHAHGALVVRRIEDGVKEEDARDARRVWMDERPLRVTKSQTCYVHRLCAIYSPMTLKRAGANWANVAREVRRSRFLSCTYCKERGGHIGCNVPSCKVRTHLHCALNEGFRPSTHNVATQQFLCRRHRQGFEQQERLLDREESVFWDLARGSEAEAIVIKDRDLRKAYASTVRPGVLRGSPASPKGKDVDLGGSFVTPDWTYVATSVDSDRASFDRRMNRQEQVCCDCKGDCSLSCDCPCRRRSGGLGYTKNGLLNLSVVVPFIYECGPLCRCHVGRCQNRTSQKGVQKKLSLRKALFNESSAAPPRPVTMTVTPPTPPPQMTPRKRKRRIDALDANKFFARTRAHPERDVPIYDLTREESDSDGDDGDEDVIIVEPEEHEIMAQQAREERQAREEGQAKSFTVIVQAEEQIPAGSFICQFAGQLVPIEEHPNESSTVFHIAPPGIKAEYALDASRYGNVARFIRSFSRGELRGGRRCQPNVVHQYVLGPTNQDPKTAVVALFASRTIYAGDELIRQRDPT
eukprot:scaffold935_cov248-Pinguiococcus_pyrenoidosus.AAC.15